MQALILSPIPSIGEVTLPPDGQGAARAFSRIGYELEQALADLVDNSVDAGARGVEISLFRSDKAVLAVSIADDGSGMTDDRLQDGMRFASNIGHDASDLGTFGMGMKTASFSQCRSMTVISRAGTSVSACRWTHASIRSWACEILDPSSAIERGKSAYSALKAPNDRGTIVLWEDLDRMKTGDADGDLDEFLEDLLGRLELHLGLTFHRFIATERLNIYLTVKHLDGGTPFPRKVQEFDPFGYLVSGKPTYPAALEAAIPGLGPIRLMAHIWPPRSADPAFLLGRRTGTHAQGFYFYRNNRLVQAGGWNGALPDGFSAELSLARVAVDLPPGGVDVNVQKSGVQLAASAPQALVRAHAGKRTFLDFIEDAQKVYAAAKRLPRPSGDLPMVIRAGIPAAARERIRALSSKRGDVREIDFEWRALPANRVFDLEPDDNVIVLNSKYRSRILGGTRGSSADAPVVKALIFLLLQDDLKRSRSSKQQVARLEECNRLMVAIVMSI